MLNIREKETSQHPRLDRAASPIKVLKRTLVAAQRRFELAGNIRVVCYALLCQTESAWRYSAWVRICFYYYSCAVFAGARASCLVLWMRHIPRYTYITVLYCFLLY